MSQPKDLLEKLSNAHGVSGYESSIGQMIEDEVRPYVDDVRTDKMGISKNSIILKYNEHNCTSMY